MEDCNGSHHKCEGNLSKYLCDKFCVAGAPAVAISANIKQAFEQILSKLLNKY